MTANDGKVTDKWQYKRVAVCKVLALLVLLQSWLWGPGPRLVWIFLTTTKNKYFILFTKIPTETNKTSLHWKAIKRRCSNEKTDTKDFESYNYWYARALNYNYWKNKYLTSVCIVEKFMKGCKPIVLNVTLYFCMLRVYLYQLLCVIWSGTDT